MCVGMPEGLGELSGLPDDDLRATLLPAVRGLLAVPGAAKADEA